MTDFELARWRLQLLAEMRAGDVFRSAVDTDDARIAALRNATR